MSKRIGVTLPVVLAKIPGSGCQAPMTQAVRFEEAFIVGSTKQALRIRLPFKDKEFWLARSQVCTVEGIASLDQHSRPADHGVLFLPVFIVKRLFKHAKEVPAKQ